MASVAPLLALGEEDKEAQYGKYVCITDRAVGFQTEEKTAERFAGRIQMSPEKQKFFATIMKMDNTGAVVDHTHHDSEWCSDPEGGKKLQKEWEEGIEKGYNMFWPNVETFFSQCLAR